MTRRLTLWLMALGFAVGVGGCSRYTADDLTEGVPVSFDQSEDIVESASLIAFWDLPGSVELSGEVGGNPAAFPDLSEEWDTVVIYTAGPFCGVPPRLEASSEGSAVTISVTIRQMGNCDSMQYTEAIGLNFVEEPESVMVIVHRDD